MTIKKKQMIQVTMLDMDGGKETVIADGCFMIYIPVEFPNELRVAYKGDLESLLKISMQHLDKIMLNTLNDIAKQNGIEIIRAEIPIPDFLKPKDTN